MAPVTATSTGVPRQFIDDEELSSLLKRLSSYDITTLGSLSMSETHDGNADAKRIDVEGLVGELERWPQWKFQETADLYEWIKPLNAMDAALRQIMKEFPALMLVGPTEKKRFGNKSDSKNERNDNSSNISASSAPMKPIQSCQAESEAEVNSVPPSIIHATSTILRFLSTLLRHAMQKSLFNSVAELSNLLAAADDGIAALALEVLSNLAAPPLVHRLQSQETAQHTTTLHAISNSTVHSRLMLLAKGWGTRGCGLGLATCITTDDSSSGQGNLPNFAGSLDYSFLPSSSSQSVSVKLSVEDIVTSNNAESDVPSISTFASISSASKSISSSPDRQNEKRRKVSGGSVCMNGPALRQTKSTAHLFFKCLNQIGSRSKIAKENLFALLVHIRLAASFHSQAQRTAAVQRRMHALMAVLYAHPSQDVLAGYFHAQPELCTEIGDLVRPIVSATAISATGSSKQLLGNLKGDNVDAEERRAAAIASIVDPATISNIPYNIRAVALEVFTALVARKDDGAGAGLSPVARQTHVLAELGVGKGQFLGLLPTLIRYSLASLNVFLSRQNNEVKNTEDITMGLLDAKDGYTDESFDIEELGLDLGLTFLEATKPPASDKNDMEAKALEFVEIVLSLTSSIVSVTTGTASLTDCGLVPALVSTIALTAHVVVNATQLPFGSESKYCSTLLKFITAQAIQILEGAIITHNPALLAFHDLQAVDLLVTLLHYEFQNTCKSPDSTTEGSTRVLLFSILNCLTVVFHHQETNPRSTNAPLTPAEVLRRPEMTEVLMGIMKNVHSYGGVLGALATTILSDIMNSDPKIVHYVYECGLADTFFRMIKGSQYEEWDEKSKPNGIMNTHGDQWHEPDIPPTAELIMSLPNIVIALSLTEEGRKRVLHVNPMPELLSLMCIPRYSMPYTRCMLNDMASIIGSGLDELMRHVENSKSPVIKSLVAMIERVIYLGGIIVKNESDSNLLNCRTDENKNCRICLMHYASNIGQALEHVLQNEENCGAFVNAGGVEAILKLHPLLVVRGRELLAHISCQSSPSVANLSHSTAATSLMTAIKRCAVNDKPSNVIKKIMQAMEIQLDSLEEASINLKEEAIDCSKPLETVSLEGPGKGLNVFGILEHIPRTPLHRVENAELQGTLMRSLPAFLLEIINTEWLSQVFSEVIRVSCQRTSVPDVRSLDRSTRLDWQKDLASKSFKSIFEKLGILYRTSILEACRIRSKEEYDDHEVERCKPPGESKYHPDIYRLRIVCSDGAVVRDGIDIDSCDSVTNLEMGEEIEAYDRCINRSGIMRYRTAWGWVSEQTRGHGREPISEVLQVSGVASHRQRKLQDQTKVQKPVNFGIPDLCSAGASILARIQNSQCSLFASLSRVTMVGTRMRSSGNHHNPIASHIGSLVRDIGCSLRANFDAAMISDDKTSALSSDGLVMYMGNMLSAFHSTLYEERRDKQYLNVMVLCNSLYHDGLQDSFLLNSEPTVSDEAEKISLPCSGFYGAIRLVIRMGLSSIKNRSSKTPFEQRLSRAVASSFPSAISLLKRLSSQNLLIDPQLGSTLQKIKITDFAMFLDDSKTSDGRIFSFRHNSFARSIHCQIGAITHEFWVNQDLKYCPAYMLNPILSLTLEVLTCVQQSTKKSSGRDDDDSDFRQHIRRAISSTPDASSRTTEPNTALAQELTSHEASVSNETDMKPKSDEDIRKDAEAKFDSKLHRINNECYQLFKDNLIKVGLDIIEGSKCYKQFERIQAKRFEDLEETEANTIVASSFVLEICSRYPAERSKAVEQIIYRMTALMDISSKISNASIPGENDGIFTSLCHSALLLLKALPRTRVIVLENNLVSLMIQCLRSVTSRLKSVGLSSLPPWISPALLFLEIMAQPMALPAKREDKDILPQPEGTAGKSNRRDDYEKVFSEHKKQRTLLSKTSKRIASALAQKAKGRKKNDVNKFTTFVDFPTFAPLINQESADHCLSLCLQLLRHQKRQKRNRDDCSIYLPAHTTHATILLLTRILSYEKVASRCLRMGGVDLLLSLHPCSRFKGHVVLITLALRRMMEDESVLQVAMEIEIRSVVTKLLKKQGDGNGIQGKTFVKALGPMICRDPVVFLKAAATSISVQAESAGSKEQGALVTLLPTEERSRNARVISDCFRSHSNSNGTQADNYQKHVSKGQTRMSLNSPMKNKDALKKKQGPSPKCFKNKSPLDRQSKKSQKREKQEKILIHGTPANHVIMQILSETIKSSQGKRPSLDIYDIPFLCVFEYLEIISDLLLAIPACSTAICNYRIPGAILKGKSHQRNIIHYLLHSLLPQPREISHPHHNPFERDYESEEARRKKRENFTKIRIAQSSARLLVALVARVGEGRRKVISELSAALNEKLTPPENDIEADKYILALQAWGELSLGLAAPRRTAASTDDSSLSFEVLKVMLEYGMAHSLMNAIKKVELEHPLTPSTCANLLKPLEILTRPSVIDTLQSMADKEEKRRNSSSGSLKTRTNDSIHTTSTPQLEVAVCDGMLTEDFDADSVANEDMIMEDGYDSSSSGEDHDSVDDGHMIMSDSVDEDVESESDSENSNSESENDVESFDDDDDQLDHMEIADDEEIMSDSESEVESDEEEDVDVMQMDFEESYDDNFHGQDEEHDDFLDADGEGDEDEDDSGNGDTEEEGWTNIDSVDLGGMLFSSRNGANPVGRPRQGGLMIEAAASVLNNILRSGEIQMDAIAEIEQSLGIRIPNQVGRNFDADNNPRSRHRSMPIPIVTGVRRNNVENSNDADLSPANQGPIGETPVIIQSNPPDNGFSSIGSVGRNGDINFMEYLFGGPVFGSSRVYYDQHSRENEISEQENRIQRLLPVPSSVDVQLFPGGPTSCTHTHVTRCLHSLLAGVSLAPLNSLVSINMRVDDQAFPRARRSNEPFGGGWTDIISNSRGNIIRLNRTPALSASGNRLANNSERVPDSDGASDFTQAFERTLSNFAFSQIRNDDESGTEAMNPGTDFFRPRSSGNSEEASDNIAQNNHTSDARSESSTNHTNLGPASNSGISNPALPPEPNANNVCASDDGVPRNMDIDEVGDNEAQQVSDQTSTGEMNTEQPNDNSDQTATTEDNTEHRSDPSNATPQEEESSDPHNVLTCPSGMDPDVFAQLPLEMQREIVGEQENNPNLDPELDEASGLDPEVLAALPEDMRREVIEQERNERRLREQEHQVDVPADPSRAEDLDGASFIASLAPDLREEILMTADDEFLSTLPPDLVAEAQLLRERALMSRHRREMEAAGSIPRDRRGRHPSINDQNGATVRRGGLARKRQKTKIRVDCNRQAVTYVSPKKAEIFGPLITPTSMKALVDLLFLLSPVRPQKLIQKLFQNLCFHRDMRKTIAITFIALLNDEPRYALDAIQSLEGRPLELSVSNFPACLIGTSPEVSESDPSNSRPFFRKSRASSAATAIALNLPVSANRSDPDESLSPVVARRIIGTMSILTKNASRLSLDILRNFEQNDEKSGITCLDTMLSLLAKQKYYLSSSNLEDLLGVIESICSPLSTIPIDSNNEAAPSKKEIELAASAGKEYVTVPRATVSPSKLKLLCSILRLESCKDSLFARVSSIARRLCRVEANRKCILDELALVAHSLGSDAIRDLRSLRMRLNNAVKVHYQQLRPSSDAESSNFAGSVTPASGVVSGTPSSAVTLSTNNTELKLLRVLQTLHSLCAEPNGDQLRRNDEIPKASKELVILLQGINLDGLWEQLNACLSTVSILEGVTKLSVEDGETSIQDEEDDNDSNRSSGRKKLQNSVAGLLTRFLPTIETFFVVNACVTDVNTTCNTDANNVVNDKSLIGGEGLFQFIERNKVLINALLRGSPILLDKGLRAMVQIPRCRSFLDFDVKRYWFKQQVRKLRSQASRRHGNLRLNIRRQYVFGDAYRQLSMRTADELRGRLHITFANEEGVDAGGLSREFFGILAKEMFNPNYALFTSTEDGCTFQPNPHSSINREHLDYFRFVGRIVGKAVADGFLLDAHFTRSLYKHMLGIKPTYHDMQAIDPDYYKNLKMILDYNLEDIGLDLTFSTITHWFGRSQVVDLVPNGRNIPVTDEDKEKYVSLVCQHRMTTAIEKQIKAYLDGFYELVKPTLISIFTPKELELLISGMPDIDILDLKKNTEYHGFRPADKEIVWFWNIMFSLSKSEKAAFLQFVTGSSKVPLSGFSDLQGMRGTQKFSIHKANGSVGALMTAHTCFNSLDLPTYKNEDEMKEKLLYAIKEGAGSFQFS